MRKGFRTTAHDVVVPKSALGVAFPRPDKATTTSGKVVVNWGAAKPVRP